MMSTCPQDYAYCLPITLYVKLSLIKFAILKPLHLPIKSRGTLAVYLLKHA